MSKAHRLTRRKSVLSQNVTGVPLNFLLGATDQALDDYELARLAAIADLRKQIQELLDALNQEMALASLVRWFRVPKGILRKINAASAQSPWRITQ